MKTRFLIGFTVLFLLAAFINAKAGDSPLVLDTRTAMSQRAAQLAVKDMPGPYSWSEYRTCSTYVSTYLRHLSFPVDGLNGQFADYPDPFPWSSTVKQVSWLRNNFPQYTQDAPLLDFLEGKLWDKIPPGSIVYIQTALNHNGYNTYYHTVVLVGYDEDGLPRFAEMAAGMKKASSDRSFQEMTNFLKARDGSWKTDPYPTGPKTPDYLLVTWADPLAVINEGSLWLNPGQVVPSGKSVESFDEVITVNLYDGTTTVFKKQTGARGVVTWQPIVIDGRTEFYAVTGRLLPANKKIGPAFLQARPDEIYDRDFGVYYSNKGVYQHTWTPQLLANLDSFAYIMGFGGLDGGTDTSVLRPQVYDEWGKLVDYYVNSSFTIHRVPDVTQQDILLRTDLLVKANAVDHSPIPVPKGYLSSGCVNYDAATWALMKQYLMSELDAGKEIAVVFSYPDFDLDLLPTLDLMNAAFTGPVFNKWCSASDTSCDQLDRRNFNKTYLDE